MHGDHPALAHARCHVLPPQYIRQSDNTVQVLAGVPGQTGYNGDDQLGTSTWLNSPSWLYVAGRYVFFSDFMSHRVRQLDLVSGIVTVGGSDGGTCDALLCSSSSLLSSGLRNSLEQAERQARFSVHCAVCTCLSTSWTNVSYPAGNGGPEHRRAADLPHWPGDGP